MSELEIPPDLARPAGRYPTAVLPVLVVVEAGFVLSFAALNWQATSAVPAAQRAVAVPLYQVGVQLGAAVLLPAVAVLAAGPGGSGLAAGRGAAALIAGAGLTGLLAAGWGWRAATGRLRPLASLLESQPQPRGQS